MFAEFARRSSEQLNSIIKKCFISLKNSSEALWLLVALILLLPTLIPRNNPRVEQAKKVLAKHQAAIEERELEAERRWWAIKFYDSTIYEPGDFPKEGYYQEDGTPWTPEVGGLCYDSQHDLLLPFLDIDYQSESYKSYLPTTLRAQ